MRYLWWGNRGYEIKREKEKKRETTGGEKEGEATDEIRRR
jgi:hypothetical protein